MAKDIVGDADITTTSKSIVDGFDNDGDAEPPLYTKMQKFAVDLAEAKRDSNGEFIKNTIKRFMFVNNEWIDIPKEGLYDTEDFANFIKANFPSEAQTIEDNNFTHIFTRLEKTSQNLGNTSVDSIYVADKISTFDEGGPF